MYYVEMYMNIYNKFGKNSPQMKKYIECYHIYNKKPHVVQKVYKAIMKGEPNKCSDWF
jgi:hypothetical protein